MRTAWFLTGVFLFVSSVLAQGDLTPPGPPGPTMKTLDQVEARTPVNATTCPGDSVTAFIISAPGSYYLTGNVAVTVGAGISINADNVTLDLNGFTISSSATTATDAGVYTSSRTGLTIVNGRVAGTTTISGTTFAAGGFSYGVELLTCKSVRIERVSVRGVGAVGILANGTGSGPVVIEDCTVGVAALGGIQTDITLASTVRNCAVDNCSGDGVSGATVENCVGLTVGSSSASSTGVRGSTVINCTGAGWNNGIFATQTAMNCVGSSPIGQGLYAFYTATSCRGYTTGAGGTGLGTGGSATNCYGSTGGTTSSSIGMNVTGVATGCTAANGGGSSISLKANIALSCSVTGTTSITNRYNMPTTP